MNTQPVLETERLYLRPFCLDDVVSLKALASDFDVAKTTLNIPYPYTLTDASDWIKTHDGMWIDKTGIVFAIVEKQQQCLIGSVSLFSLCDGSGEIGYWIGKPFWNTGYCTEAAKTLVEFCFLDYGVTHIIAEHLVSNPASGRVMENIGMQFHKTISTQDRYQKTVQVHVYSIDKQ